MKAMRTREKMETLKASLSECMGSASAKEIGGFLKSLWVQGVINVDERRELWESVTADGSKPPFDCISFECELNRAWVQDDGTDDDAPIGETNFVVPEFFVRWIYETQFSAEPANKGLSVDEFLDVYEPEEYGERIYQEAKKRFLLIEESHVDYFEKASA